MNGTETSSAGPGEWAAAPARSHQGLDTVGADLGGQLAQHAHEGGVGQALGPQGHAGPGQHPGPASVAAAVNRATRRLLPAPPPLPPAPQLVR